MRGIYLFIRDFLLIFFQGPKSAITYAIAGDQSAPEFFYIHPTTGAIYLGKKLTADGSKTTLYMVSIPYITIKRCTLSKGR